MGTEENKDKKILELRKEFNKTNNEKEKGILLRKIKALQDIY